MITLDRDGLSVVLARGEERMMLDAGEVVTVLRQLEAWFENGTETQAAYLDRVAAAGRVLVVEHPRNLGSVAVSHG